VRTAANRGSQWPSMGSRAVSVEEVKGVGSEG